MKKIFLSLMLMLSLSIFAESSKPNILFILTDDMGYSDVNFNQSEDSPVKDIVTPNIDALANAGTIFKSAYACHMFCGPSRTGIMTGRYPHEIGAQFNLAGFSEYGIDTNEVFVSEPLHDAGYYTSIIGKWHLGEEPAYRPNNRGFDHFYGFLGGGHDYKSESWKNIAQTEGLFNGGAADGSNQEYKVALRRNDAFLENPPAGSYLTDMLTDEAITVVNTAKDDNKPFFLYLAYNAPHTPLNAKDADIAALEAELGAGFPFASTDRKNYCAMMHGLDKQIGRVIQQLKDNGQFDNTLIVFTSDNGGKLAGSANNHPLQGGKGDIEEGGIRVPFFMLWPNGMADAPREYNHVINSLDLYPTFLAVSGATTPAGKHLDGKNIIPDVIANTDVRPNTPIFNMRQNPNLCLNLTQARIGNYKAKTNGSGNWLLYDVATDPSENTTSSDMDMLKLLADSAKAWSLTTIKPYWFDNPTWGWDTAWVASGMPNWEKTYPAGIGELPEGLVPVSLTWANGGTDDRKIEQGGTDSVVFTYNSGITGKAYILAESGAGSPVVWSNDVWQKTEIDIEEGLGNKVKVVLNVPAEQAASAAVRLFVTKNEADTYLNTILDIPQLRYMDIVAPGSVAPASALKITEFKWVSGKKTGEPMPANGTVKAKISYNSATSSDKLYAVIAYKAEVTGFDAPSENVEITFPAEAGYVEVDIPARAFSSTNSNVNTCRIHLGRMANDIYGNRMDVGSNGNANDDIIYGTIQEASASVEQNKEPILVYPNPSEGVFYLNLKEDATLTVYNLEGKVVKVQAGVVGKNTLELVDNGTYILTILNSKGLGNTLLQVK